MPDLVTQALTTAEDTFCLAIIEFGGNLGAAYKVAFGDASMPAAKARELLVRPEIAKRVHQLSESIQEHTLMSVGSHLTKLAEIRDMAMDFKQLKVALESEIRRADIVGIGVAKAASKDPGDRERAAVVINIGSTPGTVQQWAEQYVDAVVKAPS